MTILTKPNISVKLNPKDTNPVNVESGTVIEQDENGNNDQLFLINERTRKFTTSTLLLILAATCLACTGLLIGLVIYRRIPSQQSYFRGMCNLPYDGNFDDNKDILNEWNQKLQEISSYNAESYQSLFDGLDDQKIFPEELDLGFTDDDSYAKITVPDFRNGRVGKFLHDFKANQTAIIDETAKRCFVMPLDRDAILPPKSLADVVMKMYTGYYDINTSSVRKNMRVVTPEVSDLSTISTNIQMVCDSMSIYRLEKVVGGVVKRSTDSHADFVEFSGSIISYNINMDALNKN